MASKASSSVIPKVKFTQKEDDLLTDIVERLGTGNWELVAKEMKKRTARQCRERWINYLSPELRNDPWTPQEDKLLDELYENLGSKWQKIAEYFPTRSGNCVRNRFKLRQRRMLKEKRQKEKKVEKVMKLEVVKPEPKDFTVVLENILTSKPDTEIFDLFDFQKDTLDNFFAISY